MLIAIIKVLCGWRFMQLVNKMALLCLALIRTARQ